MLITKSSDSQQVNSVSRCTRPSKVRGASLPQEYELARLIQNVETQHPSWSTATPACEWCYVECNQEEKVEEVSWSHTSLSGELHLSYLPFSVKIFDVSDNQLTGSVDLTHLPEANCRFNLSRNRFSGQADLTKLPNEMEELYLIQNQFSGNVCLTQLPIHFLILALNGNQFEGTLDLEHLPIKMEALYLEENKFRGTVILDTLPPNLHDLWLNDNTELCGTLDKKETGFARIQNTKIIAE